MPFYSHLNSLSFNSCYWDSSQHLRPRSTLPEHHPSTMLNARCPAHPPTRSQSPLPSTLLTLSRKPWEPAVFPEANSPVSFYASLDRLDTLLLCITAFLMLVSPRGLENLQQPLFPPPLRPGTSQGPAASRPGVRGTGHSPQFAAGRTQALGLGVPVGQPRSAATVGKRL